MHHRQSKGAERSGAALFCPSVYDCYPIIFNIKLFYVDCYLSFADHSFSHGTNIMTLFLFSGSGQILILTLPSIDVGVLNLR